MKETIRLGEVINIPEAALGRWHGAVMATKRRIRSGETSGPVEESIELTQQGELMLTLRLGSSTTQARVLRGEWSIRTFESLEASVHRRIARMVASAIPSGKYSCEILLLNVISLRGYRCRTSGTLSFFYNGEGPFVDPLEDALTAVLRRMRGEAAEFPRSL